jgi:hypothetical protein
MKRVKYLFVPVLVTLVVLAVSLHPSATVTRKASAAPRAAVVTKYLMIPAAAFNVQRDGLDFKNNGHNLRMESGSGSFVTPVNLPQGARIRSIKLFAHDANTVYDICVSLHESYPKSGSVSSKGHVCTTGSSGRQQPVKYLSQYVKWYYGYHLLLVFPAYTNLTTYAVMLKCTVNQ